MHKIIGVFIGGMVVGFCTAMLMGKTQKQIVRVDAVTLNRSDLTHLRTAIDLVSGKAAGRVYSRYESNSGRLAFECPTDKGCNLELPAAPKVVAPEPVVTLINVETEAVSAVAKPTALDGAALAR